MDPKRRGKRVRWLRRLILFGLICLAGTLLGIYLARVEIVQYFAEKGLAKMDQFETRFAWDRLDYDSSSLSDVYIRTDAYHVSIEQINVRYDLKTIWESRELKKIQLQGVELFYDLTGPSTVDLDEVDAFIKSGIPFPLESVSIRDAKIVLLTEFGETAFDLNLDLSRDEESRIHGEATATTLSESISLKTTISDRIQLSVRAKSADIDRSMKANGIDWKSRLPLPQNSDATLSDATIDADFLLHGINLESASVTVNPGPASYREIGKEVELDGIRVMLKLAEKEITALDATVHLKRLSTPSLTVLDSEIQIGVPNENELTITLPETQWKTNHKVNGLLSSQITARIGSEYELESYSGDLRIHELQGDAFDLSPVTLSFEGTLDTVSATTPSIVDRSTPWLVIEDFSAVLNEMRSENPAVELSARIAADPAKALLQQSPSVFGNWNLGAKFKQGPLSQKASLTLSTLENEPVLKTSSTELLGTASLKADFEYWPESQEGATTVSFSGSNLEASFGDWSLNGGLTSMELATGRLELASLVEKRNDPSALIELITPQSRFAFNLQGNEIKGPSNTTVQWFSGSLKSSESNPDSEGESPFQALVNLCAGIVRIGPETINQFILESSLDGTFDRLDTNTTASLLFENEPVAISLLQSFDRTGSRLVSHGQYAIEGINLLSSDLLSRYVDSLGDSTLSAQIALEGETEWNGQAADASARIQIIDGSFQLPSQEFSIDSINSDILFPSLVKRTTKESQELTAAKIQIGDIEATDFEAAFSLTDGNRLTVEKAGLSVFEGSIALDPFTLSLEDPDADLLLHFNRISITPAIAMLDFFDGQVTGRLNGSLPLRLQDGTPVLGEGFLELDPTAPARFSYNADGFFTEESAHPGMKASLGDKILVRLGLEPNALLEDALGNLIIQQLRLDLFSKDLPGTPMRIQLAGMADTGKAKIPLNITTNVNGTVAELLNFLTRLDSLGLVAENPPDSNNL